MYHAAKPAASNVENEVFIYLRRRHYAKIVFVEFLFFVIRRRGEMLNE